MNNKTGTFRGSWMFDTHDADYHLNDSGEIIGIECDKFNTKLIGATSGETIQGKIGNPGVYAINIESENIDEILKELSVTYASRIQTWIERCKTSGEKQIAA